MYIPPTVLQELRTHVAWTVRDLRRRDKRQPWMVDPGEIGFIANLQRWNARLAPPLVRRLRRLEVTELRGAARFMADGQLDPGESEVLAIAQQRGWVAVIDEFRGHCRAEADGIANGSTLSIVVDAVRSGVLSEREGSELWDQIQAWWDYAPPGPLVEYLAGRRPIWRPC